MVACHAVDPGSSPGQCNSFCLFLLSLNDDNRSSSTHTNDVEMLTLLSHDMMMFVSKKQESFDKQNSNYHLYEGKKNEMNQLFF